MMATRKTSLTKREIMTSFEVLPEEATVEDFIEHLNFLVAVEEGLADLEEGRAISHEEMVERVKQWLR